MENVIVVIIQKNTRDFIKNGNKISQKYRRRTNQGRDKGTYRG